LGIDDRVGSLEKGKDGDVVIFDKHPLSVYAIPQMTFVDGVVRFDINSDPADMRIEVDPNETMPAFMEAVDHEHDDSCLQGLNELLFDK